MRSNASVLGTLRMVLAFWTRRYQSKRADNDARATMIYRFQDFELDEARLELRRSGVDIAIQARVLRALIYLVRHRERVVLKGELPSPFDAAPQYRVTVSDRIWTHAYVPLAAVVQRAARAVAWLQQGRIATYLLYSFVTLIVMLALVL